MASSGYCEVYAYIADFSLTTGDASHYMEVLLYYTPQKDSGSKVLYDDRKNISFVDGYASISVKIGTTICVAIPTAGFEKCFTVPDVAAFNVADLIGVDTSEPSSPIITPSDHGSLTGLTDDDHPQYHTDARGDARYYQQSQVDSLLEEKVETSGSATEFAIARYADSTGKKIEGAIALVKDSGIIEIPGIGKFQISSDKSLHVSPLFTLNSTPFFSTIQAAINAASSGDTVFVHPGVYDESLTLKDGVNVIAVDLKNTSLLRGIADGGVRCSCRVELNINAASDYFGLSMTGGSDISFKGDITTVNQPALSCSSGDLIYEGVVNSASELGSISFAEGRLTLKRSEIHNSTKHVVVCGNNSVIVVEDSLIKATASNTEAHAFRTLSTELYLKNVVCSMLHGDCYAVYPVSEAILPTLKILSLYSNRPLHPAVSNSLSGGFIVIDSNVGGV